MFSKLDLHLSRSGHAFIFGCVHAPSPFRQPSCCTVMLPHGSHKVPTLWEVVGAWWGPLVGIVSCAKGRCLLPLCCFRGAPCSPPGLCRSPSSWAEWRPHLTTQDSTFGAHFMAPQSAGLIALNLSRASPRRFLPLAVVSSYFQLSPLFNRSPTMALIGGDF